MDGYLDNPPINLLPQVREAMETLIGVVLPFARGMIARYGEFYPFGATLRADGKVAAVAGFDDQRGLSHQEALEVLRAGLRREIAAGDIDASAVCSDVLVSPPAPEESTDAIRLDIEHRTGQALRVWLPYTRNLGGEAEFGRSILEIGDTELFSSAGPQDRDR